MSSTNNQPEKTGMSVLPFDPADLTKVRVSQAGLATLMGVTRQSVNGWIKTGKISVLPDGLIDPETAVREYLANTGGGSLRAKLLQPVTAEMDQLRNINNELAGKLGDVSEQLEQTRTQLKTAVAEREEYDTWLNGFFDLILAHGPDLRAAVDAGEWETLVDKLFDQAADSALNQFATEKKNEEENS